VLNYWLKLILANKFIHLITQPYSTPIEPYLDFLTIKRYKKYAINRTLLCYKLDKTIQIVILTPVYFYLPPNKLQIGLLNSFFVQFRFIFFCNFLTFPTPRKW